MVPQLDRPQVPNENVIIKDFALHVYAKFRTNGQHGLEGVLNGRVWIRTFGTQIQ
jgi:hypothetical protein